MIPTDLFSYAYIPAWYEQLYELSQLAAPEPWRFRQPTYETQNDQNPILERYINQVFRKQSVKYNCVELEEADSVFYIRNDFSCFHTGLYTRSYYRLYLPEWLNLENLHDLTNPGLRLHHSHCLR